MKSVKKTISLLLVFLLLFSTAMPASAAWTGEESVSFDVVPNITLTDKKNNYADGDSISFKVNVQNNGNASNVKLKLSTTSFAKVNIKEDVLGKIEKDASVEKTYIATIKSLTTNNSGVNKAINIVLGTVFPILIKFFSLFTANKDCVIVNVGDNALAAITVETTEIIDSTKNQETENDDESTEEPDEVTYTATFDFNNGEEPNVINVHELGFITEPEDPERENYIFDGWYTEKESGELFNFATPIVDDIILYAHWIEDNFEEDSFTVTFVLNDGISTGAYDTQNIMPNQKVSEPTAPERENYHFTGWYTEPETINMFNFNTRIKYNLVLYAGWSDSVNSDSAFSSSSGGGTIYSVTNIDIEYENAKVTVNVNSMSALVVSFSDEETEEVFHSISAQTPEYCELEIITIPINYELPDNFIVTATLYDKNGEMLCNPYKSIKYTSLYEEFANKTVFDFEDKTVLNFDENIDNNFGVLNDTVIQIEQPDNVNTLTVITLSTFETDTEETTVYVFENYDQQVANLEKNDAVFATDIDGVDQLFKVGEISFEDDTCTIKPSSENSMTDYYDFLKVDMHIENQETTTRTYTRQARWDVINVDATPSANITPINLTWTPKDWLKITGSVGGTVDLNVSFVYDAILFGKDYFSASVKTVTSLTGEVQVTVAPPEDDDDDSMTEKFNKEFKLPKFNIPTPITGLAVKVETGIPLDITAKGSAKINFTTKTTSGFTYDSNSGKQDIDKKERTFNIDVEGKFEVKIGPKVSVGIAFLDTVVEAKVEAQAGVKATAVANVSIVNATTADEKHACTTCVSGSAKWFVNVSVKLEYSIVEDILDGEVFNIKILDIEGQILFDKYDSFYVSLIHSSDSVFGSIVPAIGFGECPNKQYRTTVKLLNTNGEEIFGNNVNIKKINGKFNSSGTSTFVDYLYNGQYTINTNINNTPVAKTVVVSGSAQTISLKETSSDGKITGKIRNSEDNASISNATILIKKDDLVVASLSSDADGNYSATLPDGLYCVEITKDNYVPFMQYVTVTESNETYLETALLVAGDSTKRGGFSGKITDAVTGNPVKNVNLTIWKGWDNTTGQGNIVTTLQTDENGVFTYDITTLFGIVFGLESGNYTAVTNKAGYADTSFNIIVLPGTVKGGQNTTVAPITQGNYRVVLTWGARPSDLDSHMTAYTKSNSYDHIYYSRTSGYTANLDRDDTNSYGPETITITNFDNLNNGFTYSVHDFSNKSSYNSKALSASGAVVELYKGNTLLKKYYVPTDKTGTVWRVFSIDADGNITDINHFYNQSNAGSVN